MKVRIGLASLFLSLLPSLAQPQAAPQQKMDPAKEAAIRRLIEIMGGKKMMDQMAAQMVAQTRSELTKTIPQGTRGQQIADAYFQKLQARLRGEEVIELIIPIYNKYFAKEDIEALIQFYQSPLGQRFLQVMPQIASESLSLGMRWGQRIFEEIQKEMENEFPELKQEQKPARSQP